MAFGIEFTKIALLGACGLMFVSLLGCRAQSKARVKDLAYNSESGTKNVLAIFTAPNPVGNTPVTIGNDASDVIAGITGLDQGFQVYKNEASTSAIVERWLKELADDQHLSDDGTMFIYIAGHGARSAQAQMNDGTFVGYDQIAQSINVGRKRKPLKRLVVMIFGCFSGSWIDVVRNYANAKVADEVYVLTSSAAWEYSYFNKTNSQLVDAFRTVLNDYKNNPGGVTIGQFFQGIQNNVHKGSPQYFATSPLLLNETLFSKKVLELYKIAEAQGIMPSPNDFSSGKRTPNKDTIASKRDLSFDPEKHCKFDIIINSDKQEICSAWNRQDTKEVFAFTSARTSGPNRCDANLLMSQMNAESYSKFYEHCDGILRAKSGL